MSAMKVVPCTSSIGAAITGVDLSDEISDAEADFLYEALLNHFVLFFLF